MKKNKKTKRLTSALESHLLSIRNGTVQPPHHSELHF